jgi:hypothetical protein
MPGSDINLKTLVRKCNSGYDEILNSYFNFNWPLKCLSILHQTYYNSLFYWNMNSVNNRSMLSYTRHIPRFYDETYNKKNQTNNDRTYDDKWYKGTKCIKTKRIKRQNV